MVFRILGFGALLAFPVLIAVVSRLPGLGLLLFSPSIVLIAFILLGTGFRVAGGEFRGCLAGFVLYLLPGGAFGVYIALFEPEVGLYWGAQWPVVLGAWLLSLFGFRCC
jgi:hypothetical protein